MAKKHSVPPRKAPKARAKASTSQPPQPAVSPQPALSSTPPLPVELSAPVAGEAPRKTDRVPFRETVDIRGVFAGPVLGQPRTQNVSSGGVFVESAHLLDVGDPVVLSFGGGERAGRLVVTGRVRWVTPFGGVTDPVPGMGIEFVGLDAPKREKLDALLRMAQPKS
jgi:Tfp pilus assembly protein PilZ